MSQPVLPLSCQLESSLRVLKLWDIDNPPQLIEIEELVKDDNYGIRMRFKMAGVPLERWNNQKERLGRFFAKGLCAELFCPSPGEIDLTLLPPQKEENSKATKKTKSIFSRIKSLAAKEPK